MRDDLPPSTAKPPQQKPSWLARLVSPFAGYSLLAFMVAGLASNGYAVLADDRELLPEDQGWAAFVDGKLTRGIADNLAGTPLPKAFADVQRGAGWLLMHDLGDRVRQGCPGWLFLAEELAIHPGREQNAAARAKTVLAVQERLEARGIALVVAVVPDKSRIEHERLCGLQRSALLGTRAADWTAGLTAAGVPAIDLATPMAALSQQGEPFLRTDTHWTEAGAQASARYVAAQLRALSLAPSPDQTYTIEQGEPAWRPGDLVRLAGLDWLPRTLQPEAEQARASTITAAAAADGATDDDLFGDAKLPRVTVMGSSFSRTSNFVPFLADALGTDVANFGRDGGKFAGGPNAYFASPAFKQTPPRLIVWEIPERDLQSPVTGETLNLP
ncbi:Alginate biosynthesis protein AlgJ [plant metagenome]|uniref:Alginate biosynthesis protein AlgJ n=1 Tax=plant metagenome TaxID=1297885 RepID=A0A484XQZ5_9ZZZZ